MTPLNTTLEIRSIRILLNLLVSGIAVLVSASLMPGVTVDNFSAALIVAVILGGVNALLAPVLIRFSFSFNRYSLALVTFSVIGVTVLLTSRLVAGFHVVGFRWALAFAVLLSAVNALFNWTTPPEKLK